MTLLLSTVKDNGFQYWLKGALAVLFTKQGLEEFVTVELTQFQKDLLASIFKSKNISPGTVCNSCTTENTLPCPTANFCPRGRNCNLHDNILPNKSPNRPCPNKICQHIRDEIRREHRYNVPSWKNTDATGWCTDAFQIGKCYMPPDGYYSVTSFQETDFNGILSITINNKRFEHKMHADFDDRSSPNVCTEAREVGRLIRHAADMSISKTELSRYIDILIDLLSDGIYLANDPNAKAAVDKLNQLKANTLTITTADISRILDEEFKASVEKQRENALQAINLEREEANKKFLDDVKDSLDGLRAITVTKLDEIIAKKVDEFKKTTDTEKKDLTEIIEKGKQQIQKAILKGKDQIQAGVMDRTAEQNELRKYLKDDLINFYRKYHSTISISPIVEENDVPIADFYVEPSFNSIDIQRKFGRIEEPYTKKKLKLFSDVVRQTDGKLYKDIYITAKAGIGKTSFVKNICMIWCQAHGPVEEIEQKFNPEDVHTMKTFEFMFMISLRDIDNSICKVDDMVYSQIINCLARSRRYDELFLEDILQDRLCLVILDGLDEWSHPESCKIGQKNEHKLPHRSARENCTILTTTRPWKLDVLNLSTTQIDRHVEMTTLDRTSSRQLISNAVALLNRNSLSLQPKTVEDFLATLSTMKRSTVNNIPFIILQRVCLWFDGESVGQSRCEIYSNILELTLSRGLMKLGKRYWSSERRHSSDDTKFPSCLLSNDLCRSHYDLILSLGRVAFETLFCPERESSIVFDAKVVLDKIPEYSLTFCLKVGLLSQNRDYRQVSKRRRTVSFQHKSVQEFLAALYIQSDPDNREIKDMISNVCCTLPGILQMSNTLVFLGGFSSSACGKTLQHLRHFVSNDENVNFYREILQIREFGLFKLRKTKKVVRSFQTLQADIVQEIQSSGQKEFPLPIEDIIIEKASDKTSHQFLKILVENNSDNIKSLCLRDVTCTEAFTDILQTVGLYKLNNLQKLAIVAAPRSDDLLKLLSNSVNTLKYLRLTFVEFRDNLYHAKDTTLSTDIVRTLCRIEQLKALTLNNIRLTHNDVKQLFETACKRNLMTEIGLYNVTCTDHESECCGEILDLSQHQYLKHLSLDSIPVTELRVNTTSLYECLIGEDRNSVFPPWNECLKSSPNLYSLYFRRMTPALLHTLAATLPHLSNLRKFSIELTNLGDTDLILSPETKIKSVYLYRVDMSSKVLRRLAESAAELPHPVKVTLEWCTVTPLEEYSLVKDYICSSSKYTVKSNGSKSRAYDHFEFENIVDIK
ncbi:uncharacterized protein LOC128559461 isoform X2 [Mercenaria mercenaria]|nr:uncharacterized protein LOC128559461 isoform X2 [Mercenaria mercenaria]XP_053407162.1 uncharacterized protein LOC128559461 isoform X2 [Mercenaria mercenaria]